MALNLTVKVHPVVLFLIVDAYERRKAESLRVIGTLLGNIFIYQTIHVSKKCLILILHAKETIWLTCDFESICIQAI